MRDRVDRRYALLVGLLLTAWAMVNDFALSPPHLGGADRAAVSVVTVTPAPPAAAPSGRSGAASPSVPSSG